MAGLPMSAFRRMDLEPSAFLDRLPAGCRKLCGVDEKLTRIILDQQLLMSTAVVHKCLTGSDGLPAISADEILLDLRFLIEEDPSLSSCRKLGEGSFGSVHVADLCGRKFAIKRIENRDSKPDSVKIELSLGTSLPPHPNIVNSIVNVKTGAATYVVMKYLEGVPLKSSCARKLFGLGLGERGVRSSGRLRGRGAADGKEDEGEDTELAASSASGSSGSGGRVEKCEEHSNYELALAILESTRYKLKTAKKFLDREVFWEDAPMHEVPKYLAITGCIFRTMFSQFPSRRVTFNNTVLPSVLFFRMQVDEYGQNLEIGSCTKGELLASRKKALEACSSLMQELQSGTHHVKTDARSTAFVVSLLEPLVKVISDSNSGPYLIEKLRGELAPADLKYLLEFTEIHDRFTQVSIENTMGYVLRFNAVYKVASLPILRIDKGISDRLKALLKVFNQTRDSIYSHSESIARINKRMKELTGGNACLLVSNERVFAQFQIELTRLDAEIREFGDCMNHRLQPLAAEIKAIIGELNGRLEDRYLDAFRVFSASLDIIPVMHLQTGKEIVNYCGEGVSPKWDRLVKGPLKDSYEIRVLEAKAVASAFEAELDEAEAVVLRKKKKRVEGRARAKAAVIAEERARVEQNKAVLTIAKAFRSRPDAKEILEAREVVAARIAEAQERARFEEARYVEARRAEALAEDVRVLRPYLSGAPDDKAWTEEDIERRIDLIYTHLFQGHDGMTLNTWKRMMVNSFEKSQEVLEAYDGSREGTGRKSSMQARAERYSQYTEEGLVRLMEKMTLRFEGL